MRFYLMCSLAASIAWGAQSLAQDADTSTFQQSQSGASDRSSERVSLQTLKNIRDPFKRMDTGIQVDADLTGKSELESAPVSDFRMVGVLTGPVKTRGLVRGPSGSVYPVSDGTKIGTRNGYVRKVLPDRIIVNEIMPDVLGEKELITSELKLSTKSTEKNASNVSTVQLASDAGKKESSSKSEELSAIAPSLKQDVVTPGSASAGAPSTPSQTNSQNPAPKSATPASTNTSSGKTSSFNQTVPPPVSAPSTSINNGLQTGVSK